MLSRSFILIAIVFSSLVLVTGQTPEAKKEDTAKTWQAGKLRDLPFPAGVDLQFVIKELARDLDMNILFDPESFPAGYGFKTRIDLKNVKTREALDYILLQEGLIGEEVGPRTLLVAKRVRGTGVYQIGLGVTPLTEQLAEYFGVEGGILVNNVRPDSPAWRAGIRAGDVIVDIDGVPVRGALGVINAINVKRESDVTLKLVRDRKPRTIPLTLERGIQ